MGPEILIGLAIPFGGTVLGAAMVFLLRNGIGEKTQKLLLGFASGVMIAASVWSLLLPSIAKAEEQGIISWLPAAVGFLCGIGFLLLIDTLTPHLHRNAEKSEGLSTQAKKNTMLFLAVTIHNIPEGMAVGVVFAELMFGGGSISFSSALVLSLGIALQNFPEGAIVSMPLETEGVSKPRAFLYGALSGAVEPIAAAVTILLAGILVPVLPYFLSFAAGAMIYVVVEELIPDLQQGRHSNIGIIGVATGFVLMMVLDISFG